MPPVSHLSNPLTDIRSYIFHCFLCEIYTAVSLSFLNCNLLSCEFWKNCYHIYGLGCIPSSFRSADSSERSLRLKQQMRNPQCCSRQWHLRWAFQSRCPVSSSWVLWACQPHYHRLFDSVLLQESCRDHKRSCILLKRIKR